MTGAGCALAVGKRGRWAAAVRGVSAPVTPPFALRRGTPRRMSMWYPRASQVLRPAGSRLQLAPAEAVDTGASPQSYRTATASGNGHRSPRSPASAPGRGRLSPTPDGSGAAVAPGRPAAGMRGAAPGGQGCRVGARRCPCPHPDARGWPRQLPVDTLRPWRTCPGAPGPRRGVPLSHGSPVTASRRTRGWRPCDPTRCPLAVTVVGSACGNPIPQRQTAAARSGDLGGGRSRVRGAVDAERLDCA